MTDPEMSERAFPSTVQSGVTGFAAKPGATPATRTRTNFLQDRLRSGVMRRGGGGATYLLVVDDEPIIREMVRRYFEFHGFEVGECTDVEDARAKIVARPPDAALLDKNLP